MPEDLYIESIKSTKQNYKKKAFHKSKELKKYVALLKWE